MATKTILVRLKTLTKRKHKQFIDEQKAYASFLRERMRRAAP
ncbi:hypothetical protein [Planococcus lenghuensis]|nr:hypothetical protein [Planococcus lenghuensis]